MNPSDIDALYNTGRPCIVGEFGMSRMSNNQTVNKNSSTTECDVEAVVTRAKTQGLPVLAWAWNGDGGSYNMVTPTWIRYPVADAYQESRYFWDVISLL